MLQAFGTDMAEGNGVGLETGEGVLRLFLSVVDLVTGYSQNSMKPFSQYWEVRDSTMRSTALEVVVTPKTKQVTVAAEKRRKKVRIA